MELECADVETSFLQSRKSEERSKHPIEKLKRSFEPKIGKILLGMSSFEQAPRFATNKHFIAMNP
jgi:hypothetical protein